MKHVIVYKEAGRYAGWPANYGIWNWGDEIVTGFTLGFHSVDGGFHFRDKDRPFTTMQSRSTDGGLTWDTAQAPLSAPGDVAISADEHMNLSLGPVHSRSNPPESFNKTIHFLNPDFAMLMGRTGLRKGCESYFFVTYDRCLTWQGPYSFPMFGELGIAARTDIIKDRSDTHRAKLFLSSTKPDGDEGRVFCAETQNGGRSFKFISWIRETPEGFDIMPSSLKLPSGRLTTALRCRSSDNNRGWIDLMYSDDEAVSWSQLSKPVANTGVGGNPPAMLRLSDGRICLIYGYRDEGSGVRYVVSEDEGETWGEEVILREDAGNHDIGYPRVIERADGNLVAVYYHNDVADGERYIAATIWKP